MQLFLKISIIKQKYSVNIIPHVLKHYNYRTYFCCEKSFPDPWFGSMKWLQQSHSWEKKIFNRSLDLAGICAIFQTLEKQKKT